MGKLPESFDDWKWPWKQGEVDEEKAARLIFNARKAEETAAEKLKAETETVSTLEAELEDVRAGKSGTDAEAQQELKDLRAENRTLKQQGGQARPEDQKTIDQLRVALKLGLDVEDAERLRGDDFDAILEDGKSFAQRHGIEIPSDDDPQDSDPDPSGPPSNGPQSRFITGFQREPAAEPSNPRKAFEALPPL